MFLLANSGPMEIQKDSVQSFSCSDFLPSKQKCLAAKSNLDMGTWGLLGDLATLDVLEGTQKITHGIGNPKPVWEGTSKL